MKLKFYLLLIVLIGLSCKSRKASNLQSFDNPKGYLTLSEAIAKKEVVPFANSSGDLPAEFLESRIGDEGAEPSFPTHIAATRHSNLSREEKQFILVATSDQQFNFYPYLGDGKIGKKANNVKIALPKRLLERKKNGTRFILKDLKVSRTGRLIAAAYHKNQKGRNYNGLVLFVRQSGRAIDPSNILTDDYMAFTEVEGSDIYNISFSPDETHVAYAQEKIQGHVVSVLKIGNNKMTSKRDSQVIDKMSPSWSTDLPSIKSDFYSRVEGITWDRNSFFLLVAADGVFTRVHVNGISKERIVTINEKQLPCNPKSQFTKTCYAANRGGSYPYQCHDHAAYAKCLRENGINDKRYLYFFGTIEKTAGGIHPNVSKKIGESFYITAQDAGYYNNKLVFGSNNSEIALLGDLNLDLKFKSRDNYHLKVLKLFENSGRRSRERSKISKILLSRPRWKNEGYKDLIIVTVSKTAEGRQALRAWYLADKKSDEKERIFLVSDIRVPGTIDSIEFLENPEKNTEYKRWQNSLAFTSNNRAYIWTIKEIANLSKGGEIVKHLDSQESKFEGLVMKELNSKNAEQNKEKKDDSKK